MPKMIGRNLWWAFSATEAIESQMQPAGQWVEVQEGPGLRWFEVGGGWRYNHWYGKVWKEEGGWRWVQDGPCWKYHVKHTGKRQREEPPLPMAGSLRISRRVIMLPLLTWLAPICTKTVTVL